MEKLKDKNQEELFSRLKTMEEVLKRKFSTIWQSVWKAFLDLDTDYDGYISAADISRFFGSDVEALTILMKNKDSKKRGLLNYKDFSKWMGSTIEPSEGFYFWHDSVWNP